MKGENIGFTRGINSRDAIDKYVKPGDLINIMRSKLRQNNIEIPHTDNELITRYLNLIMPKVNEFDIIKNAYLNTSKVYNKYQATEALKRLILNNDISCFTNQFNDRVLLKQHVLGKDVKKILLQNIGLNSVYDVNNAINVFDEMISTPQNNVKQCWKK